MRRMGSQVDAAIDRAMRRQQGKCCLRHALDRGAGNLAAVSGAKGPYSHLIITPEMVPPDPEPFEAAAAS